MPILEAEGWEGDDILGRLARTGEAAGCDMYLITGDRDMYQLSTEHVRIVGTKKGLSDVQIMTPESVEDPLPRHHARARAGLLWPRRATAPTTSPCVPGIGPKKASALIAQYGSLDEVIAHADEVKGKMGENLRALYRRRAAVAPRGHHSNERARGARLRAHGLPAYDAAAVSDASGRAGHQRHAKTASWR